MKIVCESCGAKYSIADDRITGKAFKIRCKRCSEVIVVRADQQPAAAAPQAEAQEGIWHIVIDGEQSGPFTPSQLADMLNAGTVDWEAYVWTEGFDNWLPMRDVEDLVAQVTGDSAPQQAEAQPAHKTSTLVGQPSMGADPFADDGGASDGGMFGSDAPSGAGPDLFGSNAGRSGGSPFASPMDRQGVVASSPMPRTAPDASLTGARNENSVLFSLKNLQALATGSSSTSMPPGGGSVRSPGFATGEGSGLIDIRALATATGIGDGGAAKGSKDDLLSLGSQGGAFGALGSPMLAPGASQDEGGNRTLIWALVAGVAFLSIAAVAIVYIMRAPPGQAPAVGMVAAAPVAAAPVAATPAPTPEAAPAAPSEGELAAKAAAARAETASNDSPRSTGSSRKARGGGSSSDKDAPADRAAAAPEPEERKTPESPKGPRSIDSLLDNALSEPSKGSRGAPTAAASSNLPDTPSKPDVMAAMSSVKPQVVSCGKGEGSVAIVTISVAGTTGKVTNAQVTGATGPVGSCIAQAVRKAQFPKFQQKVFKVSFPFKL